MSATDAPVRPTRVRRPTLAFGPFTFDPGNHLLRRGGNQIAAPPRVLGVLDVLLERAGDLVLRQELIDRVWREAFVTDTSLAEAVSGLRQLLGDDAQAPTYIQTVHRRGYRFVAPVEVQEAKAAQTPASDPSPAPARLEVVTPSIGGQLIPWSLAALFAILATVAIFRLTRQQPTTPVTARFAIELSAGDHFDPRGVAVALSPDGSQAVWSACNTNGCQLYQRPLDRLEATALRGTEGAS
ncbi:MAG: transcriptional regulator, partial [Vicinamibacterales bacterium]